MWCHSKRLSTSAAEIILTVRKAPRSCSGKRQANAAANFSTKGMRLRLTETCVIRRRMSPVKTETRSFRLPTALIERMREVTEQRRFPPPPDMREIVEHGIELALAELQRQPRKGRT